MNEYITPLIGIVAGALLTLAVSLYRVKVLFDHVSITGNVGITSNRIVRATSTLDEKPMFVERLTIQAKGLRSLDDVELHWPASKEPIYMNVSYSRILSSNSIKLSYEDGYIKIVLPTFPRNDLFRVDLIYQGYEWHEKSLKGTGSKYSVVNELVFRTTWVQIYAFIAIAFGTWWTMFNIVAPAVSYYNSPTQSVPVATPNKH